MVTHNILLESGTNEVEIMEFYLGKQSFGLNVLKIQALVPYDPEKVTQMPDSHPSVRGMYLYRDTPIPFIDLAAELGRKHDPNCERPIVMITHFNEITTAFLVDGVNRVHRISWQDLCPLSHVLSRHSARCIGSIHVEGNEILLIDIEHIVANIFPETALVTVAATLEDKAIQGPKERREDVKVLFAEDSTFMREMIANGLRKSGYEQLTTFDNGQDVFDYLCRVKDEAAAGGEPVSNRVHILVSDIEMPKMDGLTLCRNLREGLGLHDLKVIMFSSLINDQMIEKCKEVGADDYVNKPKLDILLEKLDRLCLGEATSKK